MRRVLAPDRRQGVVRALLASRAAGRTGHLGRLPLTGATLTQPFTPWLDYDYYKLAPGGDGSLTGWSLSGGAQQVSGGEPWNVSGSAYNSLSVPAGGTAVSPTTCVDAAYPTFRFFDVTGTPGSSAAVSVIYNGVSIPVGVITPWVLIERVKFPVAGGSSYPTGQSTRRLWQGSSSSTPARR
jgi:hypothetical protein